MTEPCPYSLRGPSDRAEIEDLLTNCKDADEGRQRLQALIAEWLRMENLVVLTGAGCSKSSGGKTLAELENVVLETVLAAPNLPAAITTVINERRSKPDTNFEVWLSYLVNAVHLSKDKKSPIGTLSWKTGGPITVDEIQTLVSLITKSIFGECTLELGDDPLGATAGTHLSFLSKLVARDSNLGRTHLFTLNYDTLFEQALELLGIQYFDGFTGRANSVFDPSVYGLDVYYPGDVAEGRVRRFDKFLHLYKLHGSIHWKIHDRQLRARHPDLTPYASYRKAAPVEKAEIISKNPPNLDYDTLGILPTCNKFVQTLDMPFAHLFRAFYSRLHIPQTFLLVLGYGFNDDHVTAIIDAALTNPSLVMLVVEPNPEALSTKRIERYRQLGKRAFVLCPKDDIFKANKFRYSTFDDFAKSIMPHVQWLDDFLKLRRFEKEITRFGDSAPKSGVP